MVAVIRQSVQRVSIEALVARFHARQAKIGVIGLGYVGLPLIRTVAEKGFPALGFDIDAGKIEILNAGGSYIRHIPAAAVTALRASGKFEATGDFSRLAEVDAILLCLPTPLTRQREPDLTYVIRTAHSIVPHLRAGQLVVLESTTYPGTTREVMRPILEESGLRSDQDFFLAIGQVDAADGVAAQHCIRHPRRDVRLALPGSLDRIDQMALALGFDDVGQCTDLQATQDHLIGEHVGIDDDTLACLAHAA